MLNLIKDELDKVIRMLEKDYQLKAGYLWGFLPSGRIEGMKELLLPSLVLLPARMFGTWQTREQPRALACIVQLIRQAQTIHNLISDDCPKEEPQFPVLTGDYLFSKYFKHLSDHQLLEWLAPLAEVICEMNEGGIIRRELLEKGRGTDEDHLRVLKKEYGYLTALACRMGGGPGQPEEISAALGTFGLHLGILWGIKENELPLDPGPHRALAQAQLELLPPGPEREALRKLIKVSSE